MIRRFLVLFFFFAASAAAQGFRYDAQITQQATVGGATNVVTIPASAQVAFCNFPANATPCTNKATTYTSQTLVTPCSTSTQIVLTGTTSCVASPDAQENWGVWVPAGMYSYTITLPGGVNLGPYTISLFPPSANYAFTGSVTTKQFELTNWYADQYCSGSLDVGLCINNTLAAMPSVSGYKAGTIRLDGFQLANAWVWNTLVTVSSPYVSIIGPGSGALLISAATLTGDHLRITTSPFLGSVYGGQFGGFTLTGGSQSNAVGIHIGDISGVLLHDLRLSQFTGTGAVGLWIDNVTNFTERLHLHKFWVDNCTKGIKLTNTGAVAATASFGHQIWEAVALNPNANQIGISYESGTLYSGNFNVTINENGASATGISISGLAYTAGPGAAWTGSLVRISAETASGSGTFLNVGAGNSCLLAGEMTSAGGLINAGAGIASCVMYVGTALPNLDLSNENIGAGTLLIGGTPTATNIPQFLANNAAAIAGVTASNYYLLRAGVAGLEAHDTSGNLGLAGNRIAGTEAACAGATAAVDVLCFDSVSHALNASYNNGAFGLIPLTNRAQTWSAAQSFGAGQIVPTSAGLAVIGTTALPVGTIQLGTAATNNLAITPAAFAAARTMNVNDPLGTVSLPYTIASGTSTMASGSIAAATCATAITTAATGTLTTDSIEWAYATAPTLTTDALLHISPYVTAGNVNFTRCNPTAGAIVGTAIVINWRVVR